MNNSYVDGLISQLHALIEHPEENKSTEPVIQDLCDNFDEVIKEKSFYKIPLSVISQIIEKKREKQNTANLKTMKEIAMNLCEIKPAEGQIINDHMTNSGSFSMEDMIQLMNTLSETEDERQRSSEVSQEQLEQSEIRYPKLRKEKINDKNMPENDSANSEEVEWVPAPPLDIKMDSASDAENNSTASCAENEEKRILENEHEKGSNKVESEHQFVGSPKLSVREESIGEFKLNDNDEKQTPEYYENMKTNASQGNYNYNNHNPHLIVKEESISDEQLLEHHSSNEVSNDSGKKRKKSKRLPASPSNDSIEGSNQFDRPSSIVYDSRTASTEHIQVNFPIDSKNILTPDHNDEHFIQLPEDGKNEEEEEYSDTLINERKEIDELDEEIKKLKKDDRRQRRRMHRINKRKGWSGQMKDDDGNIIAKKLKHLYIDICTGTLQHDPEDELSTFDTMAEEDITDQSTLDLPSCLTQGSTQSSKEPSLDDLKAKAVERSIQNPPQNENEHIGPVISSDIKIDQNAVKEETTSNQNAQNINENSNKQVPEAISQQYSNSEAKHLDDEKQEQVISRSITPIEQHSGNNEDEIIEEKVAQCEDVQQSSHVEREISNNAAPEVKEEQIYIHNNEGENSSHSPILNNHHENNSQTENAKHVKIDINAIRKEPSNSSNAQNNVNQNANQQQTNNTQQNNSENNETDNENSEKEKGPKLTIITSFYDDDMIKAAEIGNIDEIRSLLEKNANIEAVDEVGRTPLLLAASHHDLTLAQFLLDNGAKIDQRSKCGWHCLHYASSKGYINVLQFFLDKGCDIDSKDEEGWTPLLVAMQYNQREAIDFLLNQGANINEQTKYGWKAPHIAVWTANMSLLQFLLETKNIDKDIVDGDGWTPLIWSIWTNNMGFVTYLADKGADLQHVTKEGDTPLHKAVSKGFLPIVKYLYEKDIDKHPKNTKGFSLLHVASMTGNLQIVKFLIDENVNLDEVNYIGWTPLHYAAKCNRLDIVKYLVEKGANKDIQDKNGNTPLHLCSQAGYKMIVKHLVDKNANKELTNKFNKKPIDIARTNDILPLLR